MATAGWVVAALLLAACAYLGARVVALGERIIEVATNGGAELTRRERLHAAEIERLENALRHGMTSVPTAIELAAPADTEQRTARRIDEALVEAKNDSIERGFLQMKEEYAARGLSYSDEEIREHVATMIAGEPLKGFPSFAPQ